MQDCIFCKIVRGEIPSAKVYEDEGILAFQDINPVAPVHFMIIPKEHVPSLAEVDERHEAILGRMMVLASRLAKYRRFPYNHKYRQGRTPGCISSSHACCRRKESFAGNDSKIQVIELIGAHEYGQF